MILALLIVAVPLFVSGMGAAIYYGMKDIDEVKYETPSDKRTW